MWLWRGAGGRRHVASTDDDGGSGPPDQPGGRRAFLAGVGAFGGLLALSGSRRAGAQTATQTNPETTSTAVPETTVPETTVPGSDLKPASSAISGSAGSATFHRGDETWSDELTGRLRITGATGRASAFEAGGPNRRLQAWADDGGVFVGSTDGSPVRMVAQNRWDSDDDGAPGGTGFSINRPATVWRQTAEDHKGAMIEFQQHLDAGPHPYGIACENAGGTFNVERAGYKRVGWILAHYDSPTAEARPVHQHLNFETCKADLSTLITRFQISWGEDVALCSFPNSNVRIFDNRELRFGAGDAVRLRYGPGEGRLAVSGKPWQFGSTVVDPASGRVGVGTGAAAPSAQLHVQRATDGNTVLIRSTAPAGGNGSAAVLEAQGVRSRLLAGGLQSDAIKRWSIDASGRIEWGPGVGGARDTNLYRHSAHTLATDDDLRFDRTGRGPIVRSPNGTAFRIVVADDGALGTVPV